MEIKEIFTCKRSFRHRIHRRADARGSAHIIYRT